MDLIKIGFTGSPTLRLTTFGRPVVFQSLGALNQYRAPNLRSSWPCSNTRLSSPKNTTTYQRSTAQQRAESEQQKAAYEQLREMVMNMATHSRTCAPNPFWPYNHQPPPPGFPPPAPPLY